MHLLSWTCGLTTWPLRVVVRQRVEVLIIKSTTKMNLQKLALRLVLYTTLAVVCVGGSAVELEEVDGKELALYRNKLRECRNNLSELEEDREHLRSIHKEEKERLGNAVKECEGRLADLDSNDRQLQVRFVIIDMKN